MEDEAEKRRKRQRNFYLYMSPLEGHEIAESEGGFTSPSEDLAEIEIRDILKFWMTLQQTEAGEILADSAWWMTQYMDPNKELGATEGVTYLDSMTSFAVAVLYALVDAGVIEIKNPPELPEFRLSTGENFSSKDLDILTFLQSMLEDNDDDK
jgi:hypothetical protein